MDIFALDGEVWERSFEEHIEYIYEPCELAEMINKAGFTDIECFCELGFDPPGEKENRVFFIARKPKN